MMALRSGEDCERKVEMSEGRCRVSAPRSQFSAAQQGRAVPGSYI